MRRIPAEWLLGLLFLVPVLGGFSYASWADYSYRGDLEEQARAGAELVPRSIAGNQGGFWRHDRVPGAMRVKRVQYFYMLHLPEAGGLWSIGDSFSQGATALDLAHAERRAQLESGTPAADLALDSQNSSVRQFSDVYRNPTLEGLRKSQLPASTLLFLFEQLPEKARLSQVRNALRRVAALHLHGEPATRGLHTTKAGRVFRDSTNLPCSFELLPETANLPLRRREIDELITVVYGDRPAPDAIWSAEMHTPVKGTWSLVATRGRSWWNVPRYRRWVAPGMLAAAVYLAVLGALAFSMRRRRQLDEARARFLTEIAHDLRTPLTSVRLHAELLASPKRRADREEKYLGVLEREAARASELLANLLDLSRLDRGQRVYAPETRRISDLIQPCVAEFRQLYPDRADDLACEGDPELSAHIDASAFQRCVTNLLDNAGKYTEMGTSIRLAWSGAVVRVEDDGPGVPSSERGRLFRRYVRGSRTDGIAGTGLGLSLVKELMEGMGGTVEYRDGDPGACFELRLPGGERA